MKKATKKEETMETKILAMIIMLISETFTELKQGLKGKTSKKGNPLEFIMLNSLLTSVVKTVLSLEIDTTLKQSIVSILECNSDIPRYTKAIKENGITTKIETVFLPNIVSFFAKCNLHYKMSGKYVFVNDKQFTDSFISKKDLNVVVNEELKNSLMSLLNS